MLRASSVLLFCVFCVCQSFAQEPKPPSECTPFDCGKLGSITFPFTRKGRHPHCGLLTVDGCDDRDEQKIQLEKDGRWHPIEIITQAETIFIRDEEFQKKLNDKSCETFNNLTFSTSPFVSFEITQYLSLFKGNCDFTTPGRNFSSRCANFSYRFSSDYIRESPWGPEPTGLLHPNCSVIQLPVRRFEESVTDIFSLLTANFSLKVHVLPYCYSCHYSGGECTVDHEGKFHCANKGSSRKRLAVSLYILGSGLSVLILFVIFMFRRCKRKFNSAKEKESKNEGEEEWETSLYAAIKRPIRFAFLDLKAATDDFRLKLGAGGFGSVFAGTLSDGTRIAVKRLDRLGQGQREFLAEVKTIGSIHHCNLVKLMGFSVENSQRLLVYEYMGNGSLDRWIFNPNPATFLEWRIRKKIILNIARGLAYLHHECESRIAHFDVKPQNILLNSEFYAKLSDFGLARLMERNRSQVTTQMRGTPGYMAPEWLTGRITEKVDVYSFGVVMLEIVSSRKNFDASLEQEDDYNLLSIVKRKAEENCLIDVVHKCDVDTDMIEEQIEMIKLAIWCLHKDPKKRPSMLEVVKILEGEVKMQMEHESDYSFLTFTRVQPPTEVVMVASSSFSQPASILSGPR